MSMESSFCAISNSFADSKGHSGFVPRAMYFSTKSGSSSDWLRPEWSTDSKGHSSFVPRAAYFAQFVPFADIPKVSTHILLRLPFIISRFAGSRVAGHNFFISLSTVYSLLSTFPAVCSILHTFGYLFLGENVRQARGIVLEFEVDCECMARKSQAA